MSVLGLFCYMHASQRLYCNYKIRKNIVTVDNIMFNNCNTVMR